MQGDSPNECLPSTIHVWELAKIQTPARAGKHVRRRRSSFASLPKWPRRQPLVIKVWWRGGAEAWWQLEARGVTIRRPGHVCLHDVLAEIFGLD